MLLRRLLIHRFKHKQITQLIIKDHGLVKTTACLEGLSMSMLGLWSMVGGCPDISGRFRPLVVEGFRKHLWEPSL